MILCFAPKAQIIRKILLQMRDDQNEKIQDTASDQDLDESDAPEMFWSST